MHEGMLPLTDLQLEEQLDTIKYFLSSVHPSLNKTDGFRPCVELRPVNRGERNYILSRSLLLWDLSEKSIERLRAFLVRHNGQPTCLFYSVFCFNNQITTKTAKGESKTAKQITTNSALSTDEIALDFDDIDFDGYIDLVDRFEAMGVYAIWVASGHGYQAHVLLDESISDKSILKRFVYKFRAKGFSCDAACIDPARLMRLPGTFNCKGFADEEYADEQLDPPACELLQESSHRYSIDFLEKQLDKLPTVSREDEEEYTLVVSTKVPDIHEETVPQSFSEDTASLRRIEYQHLKNYELPSAIYKMLSYTPHGYRNKALGFMIKFFKTQYRMAKLPIEETLRLWAKEACDPVYPEDEFNADFKRFYYYNGLGYDSALAKKFGHIDFGHFVELRKRDIMLPLKFFEAFPNLDGKAVRLYLGLKMLEHIEEPATQDGLASLLGISTRALRPTMQDLIKARLVYQKKGNTRMGKPNTYYTQRIYSTEQGYTPFSYNDIRAYVTELYESGNRGNGELKLYLFMRWKFFSGEIFMSQQNLGQNIGVARNSVSDLVYKLQDKHFLKIKKIRRDAYFESCEYTLLR